MDQIKRLRLQMVAAAESARRSSTRIEVVDDPTELGITTNDLAQFQDTINATIDWLREHAQSKRIPLDWAILAAASALGALIASADGDEWNGLIELACHRLALSYEQLRQTP